jgi:cbb3-type cytochrome oxidase maturation protein
MTPHEYTIKVHDLRRRLGLTALVALLWSLKSGQYDDLDDAAIRILPDDELAPPDYRS